MKTLKNKIEILQDKLEMFELISTIEEKGIIEKGDPKTQREIYIKLLEEVGELADSITKVYLRLKQEK